MKVRISNAQAHSHDIGACVLQPGEAKELDVAVVEKLLAEPYFAAIVKKGLIRIARTEAATVAEKSATTHIETPPDEPAEESTPKRTDSTGTSKYRGKRKS